MRGCRLRVRRAPRHLPNPPDVEAAVLCFSGQDIDSALAGALRDTFPAVRLAGERSSSEMPAETPAPAFLAVALCRARQGLDRGAPRCCAACHTALVLASPGCTKTIQALWHALQVVDISLPPSLAPRTHEPPSGLGDAGQSDSVPASAHVGEGAKQQRDARSQHEAECARGQGDMRKGKLQGLRYNAEQVGWSVGVIDRGLVRACVCDTDMGPAGLQGDGRRRRQSQEPRVGAFGL